MLPYKVIGLVLLLNAQFVSYFVAASLYCVENKLSMSPVLLASMKHNLHVSLTFEFAICSKWLKIA